MAVSFELWQIWTMMVILTSWMLAGLLFDYPFWENDGQGNFSLINPPTNIENNDSWFYDC